MSSLDEISRLLASCLQAEWCRLVPLDVSCANPVYRVDVSDGRRAFLKIGAEEMVRCVAARLGALAECPYVPHVLVGPSADFGEGRAICLEWKECERIEIVDMTDAEADSLVDGDVELSYALQRVSDIPPLGGEDDPDRQYECICDFARRHPFVALALRGLLTIPPEFRSYAARSLKVIHGDFHALNFGFKNGRLAAVFDFDSLAWGLPCEDLAYALCEDMRKQGLGSRRRSRLMDLFMRFRARTPWPAEDWLVAVNHARLRIAARRLAKHPHNPLVAFDAMRRDRMLLTLVAACC